MVEKVKRILITGATGFVGRHLLDELSTSNFGVKALSRNSHASILNQFPKVELVIADLLDHEMLNHALKGIDIVIHLAAELKDESKMHAVNVIGTKNLLSAALKNEVSYFIHLSSVGVIGMQHSFSEIVVDEQAKCLPKNKYEETKLEAEQVLLNSDLNTSNRLLILRPTNVYGEHHSRHALLGLILHCQSGKRIMCDSSAFVNYLYVKDLTSCIASAIANKFNASIYHVGASLPIVDFFNLIKHQSKFEWKIETKSRWFFKCLVAISIFVKPNLKIKLQALCNRVRYDDSRLNNDYKYTHGYAVGIANTIDYYKKQNLLR